MFAEERRKLILDCLIRQGRVTVQDLLEQLQVSEDTVRRDLKHLADHGYLQKTHGGAVMLDTPRLTYQQRADVLNTDKVRIGHAAAALIHPDQTVFIDAGSTTLAAARSLKSRDIPLTVLTNSLEVSEVFHNSEKVRLIVTGGIWNRTLAHFSGHTTVQAIQEYRCEVALIGAAALHPTAGNTTPYQEDALVKRAIFASSAHRMVLTDHTKLGLVSACFVAPVSDIDVLVTDREMPDWKNMVPEVVVA
ncbi:DeoR/GlpR family DNA-binding transcription regulator [Deinococcus roseus]|uniref:DeoR family transcriptional regulator n=1 Tax=Deinococcus roseus TaxID=392414 RepID=A0ABQ2D224_9DEIO|nr:DeoR/GlpR family DNA-binding transcription regulator [Deinococcus roseus]GGJ42476.1 DeoR family transcriptional regulator [Deinococcus roseus]